MVLIAPHESIDTPRTTAVTSRVLEYTKKQHEITQRRHFRIARDRIKEKEKVRGRSSNWEYGPRTVFPYLDNERWVGLGSDGYFRPISSALLLDIRIREDRVR